MLVVDAVGMSSAVCSGRGARLDDSDGAPTAAGAGELRPSDACVINEFADAFELRV